MSTHFAFDDKDRVKQATDIVDLISSYLELRRQGSNYTAPCPWHDDHRPSLQINAGRQSWKCWVCDVGGDVFSFVMRREGFEFREALEFLAERAGISLSNRLQPKTIAGNPNDKQTLYKAMDWAADQFHRCLLTGAEAEPARLYLQARGIHEKTIAQFKIGFVPNQWSWLLDRSKSTSFSPEVLQACGIVAKSERGSWYERFRGRVMFPIHDVQDRAIAFGGRVLPEVAEREEAEQGRPPAKYINSPETKLYSKSDNLFGLNLARPAIAQSRHLIIVEGYTDVIAAWRAGVENTSAVCGTALGERHIQVIKRYADLITLVLDGDEAGQKRTNEILELFIAANVDLRIATLPDGQDPCDFLEGRGAGEFRELVANASDALERKIEVETRGIDLIRDTHRSSQALDRILSTIASSAGVARTRSETRMRRQGILTRLSQSFQIDLPALQNRIAELKSQKKRPLGGASQLGSGGEPAGSPKSPVVKDLEKDLLAIVLRDEKLIDQIIENISPGQFVPGTYREIYELICHCYHEGQAVNYHNLMVLIENPDLKFILEKLDEESIQKAETTEVDYAVQFERVHQAFEKEVDHLESREAKRALSESSINDEEETLILEQLLQKAKERRGI